ncbi:MAG TPA: hypothetical protein V6C89_03410 [Drouetiella sp.]|jgi:hypothetical protein
MLGKHIFLTVAAFMALHNSASAQLQQPNKKLPPTPVKTLTAPLPYPDVPIYPGQIRFISGDKIERDKADNLRQTWHIKEGRAQAVEWYKNALSSAGWKVSATKGTISARKNDETVMIFINEIPLADNYRSEMMMQYYRASR